MKNRLILTIFVLIFTFCLISLSSAVIVDDFDGSTINGTLWNWTVATDDVISNPGGYLRVYTSGINGGLRMSSIGFNRTGYSLFNFGDNITFFFDSIKSTGTGLNENKIYITNGSTQVLFKDTQGYGVSTTVTNRYAYLWKHNTTTVKYKFDGESEAEVTMTNNIGVTYNITTNPNTADFWVHTGSINGSYYQRLSSVNITLYEPLETAILNGNNSFFNASIISLNANITNATLYLWNASSLINITTNIINGTSNNTYWNLTNLPQSNYKWNVYGCAINETGTSVCNFNPTNISFSVSFFSVSNFSFAGSVFETSYQGFNITLATNSPLSATARLHYNGSIYNSVGSCNATHCNFINKFDTPLVINPTENRTFFWNISVFTGTNTIDVTTNSYSQIVNKLSLISCDVNTNRTLNFSAFDEQNKTRLNPFSFDANFDYYLGTGSVYKNLSILNNSATEIGICGNTNLTYYTNAIMAYSAPNSTTTYTTRNYFLQKYPINTSVLQIPLYLLKSSSSTSFILQVQDRNILPVSGALVNAQRCYPGLNSNQTVFISRTDSSGLTVGNFEAETALYKFFVTLNNTNLLTIDQCSKVVPQTAPYTILFQLGDTYQSPFININNLTDINSTLHYNYTGNILTWTYIDTSNAFTRAELIVRSLNYTGNIQPTICASNNTLSSAIITCNVTGTGSYFAQVYVYRTNQILVDQIVFTVQSIASTLGYYGVFLAFFIILISAFAFKFNEIAGIVLVNLAVIFCNIIGLVAFGNVFITAMVCLSIFIVAVLER